jgi:hypothetical protein
MFTAAARTRTFGRSDSVSTEIRVRTLRSAALQTGFQNLKKIVISKKRSD